MPEKYFNVRHSGYAARSVPAEVLRTTSYSVLDHHCFVVPATSGHTSVCFAFCRVQCCTFVLFVRVLTNSSYNYVKGERSTQQSSNVKLCNCILLLSPLTRLEMDLSLDEMNQNEK